MTTSTLSNKIMLALGLLLAVATGCHKELKCKQGTVLLTATFDAATRPAKTLQVTLTFDGKTQPVATVPGPVGRDSGTITVEFPSGYGAGKPLHVDIVALDAAQATLGKGSLQQTLPSGCAALTIAVTAGGSVGDGGTNDAGDGGPPDMVPAPVAVVDAKPDLVGFVTTLDGSGSSDPLAANFTYAWTIVSAPAGSTITTSSLTSTSSAKSSFMPDFGGTYQINLKVTTDDQRSTTTVASVIVPTVPLFYSRASNTDTTYSYAARLMNSDGTGDRSIGCDSRLDGGTSTANTQQIMPFFGRAYEPATLAGTPLFAFLDIRDASNTTPPSLLVGSATTNCTTDPPVRVDNNTFADHIPVSAHFSPDGTRIVYVDMPENDNQATYRLVTVSVDGKGPIHVVRSNGYLSLTPAIWLDNSTVAWLETDSNSFNPLTLFKAADANAAGDTAGTRTQILRCDPSVSGTLLGEINQFDVTPFGLIVAGSTTPRDVLENPPESAVQLYKLPLNDCSTANAKTLAAEPTGGLSWDFAISPDGLTVLFSSTHGQDIPDGGSPEPQTDIFLVPSDGSSSAQKFVGDPLYDDASPRYVAAGRQFIWSRSPRHMDMGADTPALMIANADGSHVRTLTSAAAAGETVTGISSGANRGFDCSWAPGAVASSGSAFGLLAGFWLILLSRRRRRSARE